MMTNYKLDENAKAFSYTREELFDCITQIIAHPHTAITSHDKTRAMAIFLTFADYLGNYTESDNNHGHLIYESDAIDFEGLVLEMLHEDEHESVAKREILK
jgi:hypothetical protein